MQVPFIKYIETLVIGKMSLQEIEDKLAKIGRSFPAKGLSIIYQRFLKEQEGYFKGKDEMDPVWLADWQVEKMYGYEFNKEVAPGTDGIQGAFQVLNDPLMYRLITSMALAGITEEDIELIVNGKYNIHYSSDDIKEFLHYFFNVANWSLDQKKEYVATIKDTSLLKFYKLALKGDKDYLVWKLGAAPDKSFNSMLRDMMLDSYYNFKERSKIDPDTAQKWGALAVKLTDRLERLEKETGDKQDLFEAIQFQIETLVVNGGDNQDKKRIDDGSINGHIKHITEVN
tara:strand:+ start:1600 stop:2454 length:855 start_codon:yes stop_codon:yes gene_type:complete